MRRYLKQKAAFTLLEIIVTIVILSVLASMAYTQYTRIVARASFRRVRRTILAIDAHLQLYKAKHGKLPDVDMGTSDGTIQNFVGFDIPTSNPAAWYIYGLQGNPPNPNEYVIKAQLATPYGPARLELWSNQPDCYPNPRCTNVSIDFPCEKTLGIVSGSCFDMP